LGTRPEPFHVPDRQSNRQSDRIEKLSDEEVEPKETSYEQRSPSALEADNTVSDDGNCRVWEYQTNLDASVTDSSVPFAESPVARGQEEEDKKQGQENECVDNVGAGRAEQEDQH
jgi:hypothetical protein